MGHVRTEFSIEAPIGHVWDLAMNIDRIPDYNPYMDIRKFSGPLDVVGTTFESTVRVLGRTRTSTGKVVEIRPHELIRLVAETPQGDRNEWIYRFQSVGRRTTGSLDVEYELGSGVVGEVVDKVYFERMLGQMIRHMAENFTMLAEATVLQPA